MSNGEYRQELANIAALASGQQLPPTATADESAQVSLRLVERLATLMLEMGSTPCAE